MKYFCDQVYSVVYSFRHGQEQSVNVKFCIKLETSATKRAHCLRWPSIGSYAMFRVTRALQNWKKVPGRRCTIWKPCHERHPRKCGIGHREFFLQGQTINPESYWNVVKHLHEEIQWKWPDLWNIKNRILHTPLLIHEFLTRKKNMVLLRHSPDLVPAYFHLFSKIKMQLKGLLFNTVV